MLTELQTLTLRDILRTKGLTERQQEDILLLLRYKPERVQLVFYYRAHGWTQEHIAERIGVHQSTVQRDISELTDIKSYMQNSA